MTRTEALLPLIAMIAISSPAVGQTAAELKAKADYDKVLVDTEKARIDTEKVRADLQKVLVDTEAAKAKAEVDALAPLKGIPTAGSSLSGTEKTAEALLLSRQMINGLAARIAAAQPAYGVENKTLSPLVISGSVPPSVGQWLSFKAKRKKLGERLKETTDDFNTSLSSMSFVPPAVAGAIAVAGVVLPMLKVDTAIAGVETKVDAIELENAVVAALGRQGFQIDYASYRIADEQMLTSLLAPIATEFKGAAAALDKYKATADPKPSQKIAGDKLAAAVADYIKLEADLATETNGTTAATVLNRQRALDENRTTRPLIYLTTVRVATTAVTKKGFFTGTFGSGAPRLSGTAYADYVILFDKVATRGTVSCTVLGTPKELMAHGISVPDDGKGICQ